MTSAYPYPTDLRSELVRALNGDDLTGFNFATEEYDSRMAAAFTSKRANEIIELEPNDKLVLSYALVKDLKKNTQSVTRTEIVKSGERVVLLIKDVKTGDTLERLPFPDPEPHLDLDSDTYETLQDCLDDFRCNEAALQCEANRTCEDQFASIICCLKNGLCYSVHFIIRPTSLRCLVSIQSPDFEAVAYRRA